MSDERIRRAIDRALDEVGESQGIEIERSPNAVLLGDGMLDSLGLLTFAASLEESLRRTFGAPVSVIDLLAEEPEHWTTETLADRISELVGTHVRG